MSDPIRLIVGLGNVGAEYERTRHNAGFWFVDALARKAGAAFSHERKFHGEVARLRDAGRELWLLKPGTFMNRSGQAVVALALYYKILPTEILVAHDELDLPPGVVKIKRGGGTAGHNGLKDIHAHLTTPDFWRLRLGVGHPRTLNLTQDVADFVLHPPARDDEAAICKTIDSALDVLPQLLDGQFERAMMKLHRAAQPAPATAGGEQRARRPSLTPGPSPADTGEGSKQPSPTSVGEGGAAGAGWGQGAPRSRQTSTT